MDYASQDNGNELCARDMLEKIAGAYEDSASALEFLKTYVIVRDPDSNLAFHVRNLTGISYMTLQYVLSVSERNHYLKKKAGLPNKAGTLKSILGNETKSPPSLNSGLLWESTYKKPIGRKSPSE